jgi:hypothetical protein
VVDKVAPGHVFSEYFGFPCQSSFHQLLHNHTHLSSGAGTICQKWPQYKGLSVTPLAIKKAVFPEKFLIRTVHIQGNRELSVPQGLQLFQGLSVDTVATNMNCQIFPCSNFSGPGTIKCNIITTLQALAVLWCNFYCNRIPFICDTEFNFLLL